MDRTLDIVVSRIFQRSWFTEHHSVNGIAMCVSLSVHQWQPPENIWHAGNNLWMIWIMTNIWTIFGLQNIVDIFWTTFLVSRLLQNGRSYSAKASPPRFVVHYPFWFQNSSCFGFSYNQNKNLFFEKLEKRKIRFISFVVCSKLTFFTSGLL